MHAGGCMYTQIHTELFQHMLQSQINTLETTNPDILIN